MGLDIINSLWTTRAGTVRAPYDAGVPHWPCRIWKTFEIPVQGPYHDITGDIFSFNTLRPRRNEQHFADDIFKRIFFNENGWISIKISLKSLPKGPINNIPALVQIMAWRRPGDKPLSEPMMV